MMEPIEHAAKTGERRARPVVLTDIWLLIVVVLCAACASRESSPPAAPPAQHSVNIAAPPETTPAAEPLDPDARTIADDEPLLAGLVQFEGMVVPRKGGLGVRGVIFDSEALSQALGRPATSEQQLLGAKLAIVARLVERAGVESESGVAVQGVVGSHLGVEELIAARVVAEAHQIEGELRRSKGYFSIDEFLVSGADLRWSLPGQDPLGKRVRLWGQPRIVKCDPRAQCLLGGELPLFDIARAELLP